MLRLGTIFHFRCMSVVPSRSCVALALRIWNVIAHMKGLEIYQTTIYHIQIACRASQCCHRHVVDDLRYLLDKCQNACCHLLGSRHAVSDPCCAHGSGCTLQTGTGKNEQRYTTGKAVAKSLASFPMTPAGQARSSQYAIYLLVSSVIWPDHEELETHRSLTRILGLFNRITKDPTSYPEQDSYGLQIDQELFMSSRPGTGLHGT